MLRLLYGYAFTMIDYYSQENVTCSVLGFVIGFILICYYHHFGVSLLYELNLVSGVNDNHELIFQTTRAISV